MADSTILPQQLGEEAVASFARWVESAYRIVEAGVSHREPPRGGHLEQIDSAVEHAATVTEIRRRLLELSERSGEPVVEAVPPEDPQRVCEISPAILDRYHVRSGHVELSGCTLEPHPFLRLTFPDSRPDRVIHQWFADDASPVDRQLATRLHFDCVEPIPPRLRASDVSSIHRWITAAWQALPDSPQGSPLWNRNDLVGATIVWCRRAAGKVAVIFEDGPSAEIPFDGWAADFCSGYSRPAPFRCPLTGQESYEIIALEDGTVTVPQAIARCDHSGREVVADQLSQCELTGKRVLPEYLIRCAVTGRQVFIDAAERCQWCQRSVVPGGLQDQLCRDCRSRPPVSSSQPLLKQILAEHPEYARFGGWTGWEDESVGVFVGKRRFREVVLVGNAQTTALVRIGRRWRFRGKWQMDTLGGG